MTYTSLNKLLPKSLGNHHTDRTISLADVVNLSMNQFVFENRQRELFTLYSML